MSEILTKSRARNVFYGGSLFFVGISVAMTVHSHRYDRNNTDAGAEPGGVSVAGAGGVRALA